MTSRFIPKKRMALDGVVWWYAWDTLRNDWSTFLCHSKHKKKSDSWYEIRKYNEEWKEYFEKGASGW